MRNEFATTGHLTLNGQGDVSAPKPQAVTRTVLVGKSVILIMRRLLSRLAAAALAVGTLAPGTVLAQIAPPSAVLSNGTINLGVDGDAGLTRSSPRLQLIAASAEGLAALCACPGWTLSVDGTPLASSLESFTFTATGAVSAMRLTDATRAVDLRLVHGFHPVDSSPNLYAVTVTVVNLGAAPVQPLYTRQFAWANGLPDATQIGIDPLSGSLTPTADGRGLQFAVGLPLVQPNGSQAFRLYFGAGHDTSEAANGLQFEGASVLSASQTAAAGFVLAYAAGASPPTAATGGGDGDGGSRGSGGGGGGGGGSNGNHGGSSGGASGSNAAGNSFAGGSNAQDADGRHIATLDTPGGSGPDPLPTPKPNSGSHGGSSGNDGGQANDHDGVTPKATPTATSTTSSSGGDTPATTATSTPTPPPTATSTAISAPTATSTASATPTATAVPSTGGHADDRGDGPPGLGFGNPPSAAATPELDSLALMAAGLAGLGGYASRRWRSRRGGTRGDARRDREPEDQAGGASGHPARVRPRVTDVTER